MTQRGDLKNDTVLRFSENFCERDNIAEVEPVRVHVELHTNSDTSGIHRGGQMCEWTKNGQNDLCNWAG